MKISRNPDPLDVLVDAIEAQLLPAHVCVTKRCSTPWASVTFTGARHDIELVVEGDNALDSARFFVDSSPAADYAIEGHLVADVAVTSYLIMGDDVRLSLEILTVEAL
jgi:hypothetical protein